MAKIAKINSTTAARMPVIHGRISKASISRSTDTKTGRPRITWTSSRTRKAVRLYLFSTMIMEDIVEMIQESGFNPQKRSVEKEILAQFTPKLPRSFALSRRKDFGNIRRHWHEIAALRRRKFRGSGSTIKHVVALSQHDMSLHPQIHDFPNLYAEASLGQQEFESNQSHVSPNFVSSTNTVAEGQYWDFQSTTPLSTELELMLDFDFAGWRAAESLYYNELVNSVERPSTTTSETTQSVQLQRRLKARYPSSEIKHALSLLRESWGSSLSISSSLKSISARSLRRLSRVSSMLGSGNPFGDRHLSGERPTATISEPEADEIVPDPAGKESGRSIVIQHRGTEHIHGSHRLAPVPCFNRRCCNLDLYNDEPGLLCGYCGVWQSHRIAWRGPAVYERWVSGMYTMKDHYDNTYLHFAAASPHIGLRGLLYMVEGFAEVSELSFDGNIHILHAKNTMGQTFLHVIDDKKFESALVGIEYRQYWHKLMLILKNRRFDFFAKDHQGTTLTHVYGHCFESLRAVFGSWQNVLEHVGRDIYMAKDKSGTSTTFHDMWIDPSNGEQARTQWNSAIGRVMQDLSVRYDITINYRNELELNGLEMTEVVRRDGSLLVWAWYSKWVDIAGDTLLTAYLGERKSYPDPNLVVKRLLDWGVNAHAQDRRGNTALGYAAARGLRVPTELLLDAGVSPNIRNKSGLSILARTTKALLLAAKADDTTLYANILLCQDLLIAAGAMQEPDPWMEWYSPQVRSQLLQQKPMFASSDPVTSV